MVQAKEKRRKLNMLGVQKMQSHKLQRYTREWVIEVRIPVSAAELQVESVAKTLDIWDNNVSWKHNCQEKIKNLGTSNGRNPLSQGILYSCHLHSQAESHSAFTVLVSNAAAWGASQPSSRLSFDCKAFYKEVPVPKISKVLKDNAAKDSTCHCMPQS